jgi:hypothetical protein
MHMRGILGLGLGLGLGLLTLPLGCGDDGSAGEGASETAGDGDGDPTTGDGDGDPSGDGDGDPSGDGDGDPSGDGDGDPSGDGDGDPTGDGDGDASGDGDGDPSGDGDGDPTGDGDGDPLPPSDIEVVITADNAYGFGYGTVDTIGNYYGGIENTTAGQIFNCADGPETYEIPGAVADQATHLYIVAWADAAVTQGVIARFARVDTMGEIGDTILTGDEGWEVCATGINFNPGSGGPSLQLVNEQIALCNVDGLPQATSSVGWVDSTGTQFGAVAVGEDNTTPYNGGPQAGNEFPLVCQNLMPAEAKWMWFNWDPATVIWPQTSPFLWPGGTNPDHQFLIFRLAANLIPEPQ